MTLRPSLPVEELKELHGILNAYEKLHRHNLLSKKDTEAFQLLKAYMRQLCFL